MALSLQPLRILNDLVGTKGYHRALLAGLTGSDMTHSSFLRARSRTGRLAAATVAVLFALGPLSDAAKADPPSWAPAHGYRDKHGKAQAAPVENTRIPLPPGLEGGRCYPDRLSGKTVGIIVGATLGAAIGGKVAGRDDRMLGTAVGAVIGALIGKQVGEALSEDSRKCIGETLEYAGNHQTIAWHDPDTKLNYSLTPTARSTNADGKACRSYVIEASDGATSKTADGQACRYSDNSWQIIQ
jgi:surface antigen